ncbi:MAG: hypothetical protein IJP62_10185 [Treponema sp.]|nr:hypothetical protein [Treponema sp.]
MKKIIGMVLVALVTSFGLFAGPFGDLSKNLNALSSAKSETISGTLPSGREILPVLWKYAYDEPVLVDKVEKVIIKITKLNPIENEYVFEQDVIFKSFGGHRKQSAQVSVRQDEQKFFVTTLKMTACTVDGNLKPIGEVTEIATKSQTQNSKNIAGDLERFAKELSADDYQKWSEAAYGSLVVQSAIAENATNKLKAKKWFSAHPIEGKKTSGRIFVTSVDESKREGYAYKVTGTANITQKNSISIEFHTNDDRYVDVKATESVNISGTAVQVQYTPDYESFYGVSRVVVEE